MKRFSNEDGLHAGWRNVGRLFLFVIPAALGGAAIIWTAAVFGYIDLSRELRMQRRAMQSVGIAEPPNAAIRVVSRDDACLKIESSYLDGRRLQFYAQNTCTRWLGMPNYSVRVLAHDGTTIDSGRWAFNGDRSIGPGERREQGVSIDNDSRAEVVEVRVIDGL